MPGSTDPIDVEEGYWAEVQVEITNCHVALAISDEHQLVMTPNMARKLARKLRVCAEKCAQTVEGT